MKKKYPNKYFVRHISAQEHWEVWRANVGGDIFFVEEFNLPEQAQELADRLNRRQKSD